MGYGFSGSGRLLTAFSIDFRTTFLGRMGGDSRTDSMIVSRSSRGSPRREGVAIFTERSKMTSSGGIGCRGFQFRRNGKENAHVSFRLRALSSSRNMCGGRSERMVPGCRRGAQGDVHKYKTTSSGVSDDASTLHACA